MNNEYDTTIDGAGTIFYYKKDTDILHRLDGPAVIWTSSGKEIYYVDGKQHRLDGPAAIYPNGDLQYCVNGELHRDNGPALIFNKGKYQVWARRGLYHRLDGPAVIRTDGTEEYWIDGKEATPEEISLIKVIYEQRI